jgi:hypothetical protein
VSITWDQARTKLRGDLWKSGSSSLTDDVCDRALHASIVEIESIRRWLWLEGITTSAALVAAVDNITVPTDLSSVQSIAFRMNASSSFDPPLEFQSLPRVRIDRSLSSAPVLPTTYSRNGTKLYFDTVAPIGSIYELIYTARTPEDLDTAVAAGDTNATLQRQQTGVIALAGHYVALNFLRNNDEATRKLAVWQRIQQRLEATEDEQRSDLFGGCVVPDDSYHIAAFGFR